MKEEFNKKLKESNIVSTKQKEDPSQLFARLFEKYTKESERLK